MTPSIFFLAVADYGDLGFGSVGDPDPCMGKVIDGAKDDADKYNLVPVVYMIDTVAGTCERVWAYSKGE